MAAAKAHLYDRAALRAHIERVEYLAHRHGEECHGHALLALCDVHKRPVTGLEAFAYKERREGQRGNEHALIENVEPEPACEYSVRRVARAAAHNVALRLFESERERREAVGDEVYEQQMRRFENGEAEKRCGEYREHFREV